MKKEVYPPEPIIKFEEFYQFGKDSAWFVFSFTDGDGDIGLDPGDTLSPFQVGSEYYYNFYMNYYEKQNNVWTKIDPDIPFAYRIPNITPEGRSKALEGEVIVRMGIYYDFTSTFDTIKYVVRLYDRSLNRSNDIESREILVIR